MSELALLHEAAHIGGRWIAPGDGRIAVTDPATGEVLGQVPDLGAAETEAAIAAAAAAFVEWGGATADRRADVVWRIYELLLAHEDALAALITRENGKPLAEARGEVRYTAGYFRFYAEEARRVYGETVPGPTATRRILVTRQPVGVCAMITPWNFPLAMLGRKVAAALAAGCTIVAKPADETPFSALALAELCQAAGLPDGAFNVVTGRPVPIGGALCGSPVVRKLSFTGSTEVGRLLMGLCAPTLKRLSMELGGNAPFVVFEDADLDAAVEGALASKFRNCGQTCVATNRFLVHRSVHDDFVARLTPRLAALPVGNGMTPGVAVGPLINRAGLEKVRRILADALEHEAVLHTGQLPTGASLFMSPALVTGVTDDMAAWREEIFGPLVAVRAFDSEGEAIRLANDTPVGLAAYFYTRDLARSWRVSEALAYGMVGVNTGMISTPVAPFGGVKQSGFGREGGRQGLEDYLQLKYTAIEIG